jgi:thymidylate synthase (FAD)
MNVKLISLTGSLITEKQLSPEELIVYIARVSNPSNQLNSETSDRLISYMVKNKHWSPFEMVDMTVEIVTSRAIAQQILRHRSFSFQEFSQRYAEVIDMEPIQLRAQADKNRQSSTEKIDPILFGFNMNASEVIEIHNKHSVDLYQKLLNHGVAKECARMVLPLTTQTKIYMKGSVRSWIHYLQIRCDAHTQLEHQQIANRILRIFQNQFPNISTALEL